MFSTWHIVPTAVITAALTAITATGIAAWHRARSTSSHATAWSSCAIGDLFGVGIASWLAVPLWRLSANTPALNDDLIPGVSPADVLSAPLAYIAAEIYVRLRASGTPGQSGRLAVAPAVAALVALIVNVVTI